MVSKLKKSQYEDLFNEYLDNVINDLEIFKMLFLEDSVDTPELLFKLEDFLMNSARNQMILNRKIEELGYRKIIPLFYHRQLAVC